MSVEIDSCEPDVTISCDGCQEEVGADDSMYCLKCANRSEKEKAQCSVCLTRFERAELFSKIAGLMCHACAFRHEAKACGLLPLVKSMSVHHPEKA